MKHFHLILLLAFLPLISSAQTAVVTESLRMINNSQADVMYANEFGEYVNNELDEPFPYVVIRMELEGDVREAKTMINLDMGQSYKVMASNKSKDNMILFLIPKGARFVNVLCGDGCEQQQLHYGTLMKNKVYECKVNFSAKRQESGGVSSEEMDEIKKQNEEMKKQMERIEQMLMAMSSQKDGEKNSQSDANKNNKQQNDSQANAKPAVQSTVSRYPGVSVENGVLKWVPRDFNGIFEIGEEITEIGDSAFKNCKRLKGVIIPNSVTSIGDFAFYLCSRLSSVTIPNSVLSIGRCAFYECARLSSVTIPNSVTWVGDYAFHACINLKNVTIPNSVTTIGSGAFLGCKSLENVTIPNSVTSIENSVFCDCSRLSSVTIPNSVTWIADYAFYWCESLKSVTIPNGVKGIGNGAFWGCEGLKNVTIPNSVTSIGKYAFIECRGLTRVTLPDSVTSIGEKAFNNYNHLKEINVSKGTRERFKKMLDKNLWDKIIER